LDWQNGSIILIVKLSSVMLYYATQDWQELFVNWNLKLVPRILLKKLASVSSVAGGDDATI
jgi:hypothetical protein